MYLPTKYLRKILLVLGVLGSAPTAGLAQTGTLEAGKYFEGIIQYTVGYWGEVKEFFQETKVNTKMDLVLSQGHFIIHMYGGTVEKTLLYNADSNWTYSIETEKKRVFLLEKHRQRVKAQPELTPTGDSLKVMGKWCHGYQFSKPATKKYAASTTKLYIHPDYHINAAYYEGKDISQAYWSLNGLNGCIPLKIIYKDKDMLIESTAIIIRPMAFKPADFELPKDFQIIVYDERR
jgi:hypothetical protein